MIREELEFRIARYADGDLSPAERLSVEAELAADPEARAILAEYQALRSMIEDAAGPALPKVHWDRLEGLLSSAVNKAAGVEPVASNPKQSREGGGSAAGPFGGLGIENEFAIACYADGSSAGRHAEVEGLLASDVRARALFSEYQNLDAAIKSVAYSDAIPAIRWEHLARHIANVVDAGANAGLPEEIERQIAEFTAGELTAHEALEARLASDPAARVQASEYRNLDAALRAVSPADPIPAVEWERLAERISASIDREAAPAASKLHKSRDESPYSILRWLRSPTRMALAASVLIAAALATRLSHHPGPGPTPTPVGPAATGEKVEEIAVAAPEKPAGDSLSEIRIGEPSVAAAPGSDDDDYAWDMGDEDNVVSHTPRAFVASGRTTPRNSDVVPALPF